MQVEDIARIRFAARRAAENQRYFAVSYRLFRQVVVNDQRVASRVAEVFANGGPGERCEILHGGRVGSRSGHDDRIVHRSFFTQRVDDRGYGRAFLPDGYVDTVDRVARFEIAFLVQDRIDGDSRFSGLAVADDQFALSAADRDHRVDGFQSGLQRLVHRLPENNARRFAFQRHFDRFATDQSHAVQRIAERVDHATEHRFADVDRRDALGAFHGVSFADLIRRAQQHGADVIFLEVHYHGPDAVVELQQFVGLSILQAVDPDDAVADLKHRADFFEPKVGVDSLELHPQHVRNLACLYIFRHTFFVY